MAYERVNWTNTTPVNPTNLNKMDEAIAAIYNLFRPVGSYFETSDLEFNPNTSWGGTWVLEEDGTVLVSKSNVEGSKFNGDIGTVLGEEAVQLSLPNYQNNIWNGNVSNPDNDETLYTQFPEGGWGLGIQYIENKNVPHNNIQPSKIVNRWHRTA